jgi:hypothetical protein
MIANILAFIHFISHGEKTFLNDKEEQPIICEMLESLLKQMNTMRVFNWAESTMKQAPHMSYTFLLRVHNMFATFCNLASDPSAQAKAIKGTSLEPDDLQLMSDVLPYTRHYNFPLQRQARTTPLAALMRSRLHTSYVVLKLHLQRTLKEARSVNATTILIETTTINHKRKTT